MRRRKFLAGVLAAACLPGALGIVHTTTTASAAVPIRARGMGFYSENHVMLPALTDMSRVAGLGVNMVLFDTWWNVPANSDVVQRKLVKTIDDTLLRLYIGQARNRGMDVALMPKFSIEGPGRGWRGAYVPKNAAEFWTSYRAMINHYADMARETGVKLFFVGSEMAALDNQDAQWRAVIADVRARFSGLISYNENQNSAKPRPINFYNLVDIASTTGYFPLTGTERPSVEELKSRMRAVGVPKLDAMRQRTGKPVMIGEIGYMATPGAAKAPYKNDRNGYDPQVQLNLYQALLETYDKVPGYAGEIWWSWNGDEYRSPKDKPAEDLLKAWYKLGWRPGNGTTPNFTGLPLPFPIRNLP